MAPGEHAGLKLQVIATTGVAPRDGPGLVRGDTEQSGDEFLVEKADLVDLPGNGAKGTVVDQKNRRTPTKLDLGGEPPLVQHAGQNGETVLNGVAIGGRIGLGETVGHALEQKRHDLRPVLSIQGAPSQPRDLLEEKGQEAVVCLGEHLVARLGEGEGVLGASGGLSHLHIAHQPVPLKDIQMATNGRRSQP